MKVKIRGLVFAGFAAAVFAQSALAITDDDKTVTSKTYVDTNFQNIVQKDKATGEGTTASPYATTINANSSNDTYPTSQNVYKFVEGKIVSTGGGIDGDVTKHTQKIAVFETGYTPTGSAESPSTADLDHVTGWKLIVPDSVVAESGSDIGGTTLNPGPADGHENDLTTAQAVYDFVTGGDDPDGGFHPKLTSTQASVLAGWGNGGTNTEGTAIAVGYRAYDSDDPDAVKPSEWKTFGARGNGAGTNDDWHLSYLEVQPGTYQERDKYFIDIKASALAKNATAISDGGTATGATASQTADKLATAKAVYDYAVKQQWQTTDEGKHLVIGSDGKVTLSANANTPDIPAPTDSRCAQAGGTHVCALVAYWDSTLNNNAGGVAYEWTVMAPTGSTGGGSGNNG